MQALSQSGQSVRARVEARVQGGGGRRKGSGFSLGFELHDVPFSFPCPPPPHTHPAHAPSSLQLHRMSVLEAMKTAIRREGIGGLYKGVGAVAGGAG